MMLPAFVQSPLLRSAHGYYHAFLGIDPLVKKGASRRMREVFSVSPSRVASLRQVHSSIVLEAREGGDVPAGKRREGDALWTAAPGTGVAVHTADCVPVLLALPGESLCAAVHAGWRGLAAGIVGEAVRAMEARFGAAVRGGLVAAAGPCARGCCYEVGEEVAERLHPLPGGTILRKGEAPGKWMADLQALAVEALVAEGLAPGRVEGVGPCTVCSPRFHSFRREKSLTGRQSSFIYIL